MPSFRGRKTSSGGDDSTKSIGCMSGIFHLLHSYTLDRKRLTQAGKTDQNLAHTEQFKELVTTHFSSNAEKQMKISSQQPEPKLPVVPASDPQKLSCNNPRSPTLPPEMRRQEPEPLMARPEKLHRQPGVVARLMGLDDIPVVVDQHPGQPEIASEKRQRILGALEKCDEDLRTLKQIIEVIQTAEKYDRKLVAPPNLVVGTDARVGATRRRGECPPAILTVRPSQHGRRCMEFNCEQPSPVSVLDDWAFRCQDHNTPTEKWDKNDEEPRQHAKDIFNKSIPMKKSDKYHRLDTDAYSKHGNEANGPAKTPFVGAFVGDVVELLKVCAKNEFQRIGLVLESDIFGSLVEEVISELGFSCRPSLVFFQCGEQPLPPPPPPTHTHTHTHTHKSFVKLSRAQCSLSFTLMFVGFRNSNTE